MPDVNTDIQDIKTKLDTFDEACRGIKSIQETANRNKERIAGIDQEKIDRIGEDVTKNLAIVNELKAKQEELEKSNQLMEKMLCNNTSAAADSDSGRKQFNLDMKNEITKFIRKKNHQIPEELIKKNINQIVKSNYFGLMENDEAYVRKDLQVLSDPDGGFLITNDDMGIIKGRQFETSPIRQFANVTTTQTNAKEYVLDDELAPNGGWVEETEARPDTGTPQFSKKVISTHEIFAQPAATQTILDDVGYDISGWLMNSIAESFSLEENTAFVLGDGVKKPRGFLTYEPWAVAGSYEREKLEYLTSSVAGSFEADDLKKMQNSLLSSYQSGAIWAMNRRTFLTVSTLKDTQDRYLLDVNSLKTGDTQVLLGKQVAFFDDMPIEANDSLAVAFGNFKRCYLIVDRIGMRVTRDPYTKKPFILFYTIKRTGGDVVNYQGLKLLQCAAV